MIEIHLLETLCAFEETRTLSKAAEKLHTSQPALTRSMKKLEDELGVTLFDRTKNHMELNQTGKVAVEYARRVLREDAYLEEKVLAFHRSLHTIDIGFCAPVPQRALTPLINSLFAGTTVSADMSDDRDFMDRLEKGTYQLAVTHEVPDDTRFFYKKCGHEDLYISLEPSDPLTFYPMIHLQDLDGKSILLLSQIGFWRNMTGEKMPNAHFLLQVEQDSFMELASGSSYPCFSSSFYIRRHEVIPGRINVAIADPPCHTDYYLVCTKENRRRFQNLFDKIHENTVL